jgi:hypothetical protein
MTNGQDQPSLRRLSGAKICPAPTGLPRQQEQQRAEMFIRLRPTGTSRTHTTSSAWSARCLGAAETLAGGQSRDFILR